MWISVLSLFTIANKVILSLLLFFKKNSSLPNKLLGVIVFLPVLTVLSNYLLLIGDYRFYYLVFINQIGVHALSASLYLYCTLMMGKPVPALKKFALYFITSIVPVFCWIFYEFYLSESEKNGLLINAYSNPHYLLNIMNVVGPLVFCFYMILALYEIRKHNRSVKNIFSENDRLKLKWLNSFFGLMLGLMLAMTLAYAFFSEFTVEVILLPILSNIFYFYIIYQSFNNSVLFTKVEFADFQQNFTPLQELEIEKYQNSSLSQSQILEYSTKLEEEMKNEKYYLDPDLTIQKLAGKINLSPNKLSEVINRNFDQNFFDFVNSYRVNHSKELIVDPHFGSYTLEAIAEESGFGSKTAFNRAFKKATGQTPTSYKKSNGSPAYSETKHIA